MKMVLNCVPIWSVDFFLVKDKVPERNLITVPSALVWTVDRCKSREAGQPGFYCPQHPHFLLGEDEQRTPPPLSPFAIAAAPLAVNC